jgi:hypothetical protein
VAENSEKGCLSVIYGTYMYFPVENDTVLYLGCRGTQYSVLYLGCRGICTLIKYIFYQKVPISIHVLIWLTCFARVTWTYIAVDLQLSIIKSFWDRRIAIHLSQKLLLRAAGLPYYT